MNSSRAEEYIDFNLRHAWHKISRMYNQKAKIHGLTMSIGFILLIVDKEGTPSTQLGPRMGMEPTSLSRTLKTMESKGLIYRKIDAEDKRKVLIFLTTEGVQLRKQVKEVVVAFNEKLFQEIPADKLAVFFDVMEIIDENIEDELKAINKYF
ncbi:MAG: MarR family transcriptional regulator [Brumimicrobium sp.]|nr:MarR family transcriptional regulator [Brumimicrobium sp.]